MKKACLAIALALSLSSSPARAFTDNYFLSGAGASTAGSSDTTCGGYIFFYFTFSRSGAKNAGPSNNPAAYVDIFGYDGCNQISIYETGFTNLLEFSPSSSGIGTVPKSLKVSGAIKLDCFDYDTYTFIKNCDTVNFDIVYTAFGPIMDYRSSTRRSDGQVSTVESFDSKRSYADFLGSIVSDKLGQLPIGQLPIGSSVLFVSKSHSISVSH